MLVLGLQPRDLTLGVMSLEELDEPLERLEPLAPPFLRDPKRLPALGQDRPPDRLRDRSIVTNGELPRRLAGPFIEQDGGPVDHKMHIA